MRLRRWVWASGTVLAVCLSWCCSAGLSGKVARIIFEYETITEGTPSQSSMMNLYYEGKVESYKKGRTLVMQVTRTNAIKFGEGPKTIRLDLKGRPYEIVLLSGTSR